MIKKEEVYKDDFNELVSELKMAVLRDYNFLIQPRISLIRFSENIICLLEDESHKSNEKKVIRVCRPGYHNKTELSNELIWINEIGENADIITAKVFRGKNGEVIQQFISPSGNKYYYSIQSFVEGEAIRNMQGNDMLTGMECIGKTAAKLHALEEKTPHNPEIFERFTWDIEDTLGENARWGNYCLFSNITKNELEILNNCSEKIKNKLELYGRTNDKYGLIHADLHTENLLMDGSKISLIDFDDCGYGWYLYDLASAVSQQSDNIQLLVNSYIKGYETIRKLSSVDMEMVDTFVLLRRIVRLGWMTTRKDNGVIDRDGDVYMKKTIEMSVKYLEEKSIFQLL